MRRRGPSVTFDIRQRGHGAHRRIQQLARDEARIARLAEAHGKIEAIGDHVPQTDGRAGAAPVRDARSETLRVAARATSAKRSDRHSRAGGCARRLRRLMAVAAASSNPTRCGMTCSKKRRPSSVRETVRVVRSNKRIFSRAFRCAMARLTPGCETCRVVRPRRQRCRASTMAANTLMPFRVRSLKPAIHASASSFTVF